MGRVSKNGVDVYPVLDEDHGVQRTTFLCVMRDRNYTEFTPSELREFGADLISLAAQEDRRV